MKMSLRSWTWDYGLFVCLGGGYLLAVATLLPPSEWRALLIGSLLTAWLPYSVYFAVIAHRYPCLGDLPEYQKWVAERRRQEQTAHPEGGGP